MRSPKAVGSGKVVLAHVHAHTNVSHSCIRDVASAYSPREDTYKPFRDVIRDICGMVRDARAWTVQHVDSDRSV